MNIEFIYIPKYGIQEFMPPVDHSYYASIFKNNGFNVKTKQFKDKLEGHTFSDIVVLNISKGIFGNESEEIEGVVNKIKEQNKQVILQGSGCRVLNPAELKRLTSVENIIFGNEFSYFENRFNLSFKKIPPNSSLDYNYPYKSDYIPIQFSFGCNIGCNFCTQPEERYGERIFKARPVNEIISEIDFFLENGRNNFFVCDDNLIMHPDLDGICEEIKGKGIHFGGECSVHINKNQIKKLKEAGGGFLFYGVESFDNNILDAIGKISRPNKELIDIVKESKQNNILTVGYLMITPFDTPKTINNNIKVIEKNKGLFDIILVGSLGVNRTNSTFINKGNINFIQLYNLYRNNLNNVTNSYEEVLSKILK